MTDTKAVAPPTVPEIFTLLAAEGQVPALRRTSGTFEFDIEGAGTWFLALDHGTPAVRPGVEHPTCTVTCSAGDFVEFAQGNRNFITAYLRGDIGCTGDLAFALKFRQLLPVAS